jgi:hypothetical protein
MDDAKLEFWGDMQKTLFVENTAIAMLSDSQLEGLISEDGRKAHRPIISLPHSGTYTPYTDITFNRKTASKQTLEVDTFSYAADEIDITDANQTKYPLTERSASDQMKVHNNKIEQSVMSQITNALNSILDSDGTSNLLIDTTNILDVFEEADTKLGSVDAPFENRIAVFGPHTISTMRKLKQQRETALGDSVMANGEIGDWNGYKIIQSNNLPWSATLTIGTQPTALDTVTIAGVTFQFVTALVDVASTSYVAVLNGINVAAARANLKSAIEGDTTSGVVNVTWAEATGSVAAHNRFTLNEKRSITCTSAEAMAFAGFGDIVVSEGLTNAANVWSAQKQLSIMGNKGMIDLVLQIQSIDVTDKEKGFAKLVKSMVGRGVKMFDDGARVSVKVNVDASAWK